MFVLTHHQRAPVTIQGGTTFNFVNDGIEAAPRASIRSGRWPGREVGRRRGHHPAVLARSPYDEMHLAIVLLGSGERLFDHLQGGPVRYECVEFVSSPSVAHVRFARAR